MILSRHDSVIRLPSPQIPPPRAHLWFKGVRVSASRRAVARAQRVGLLSDFRLRISDFRRHVRSFPKLGCCLFLTLYPAVQPTRAATVCPAGATLRGVDVSVFQGTIDWTRVRTSGVAFAFIRVSDGTFQDTEFSANYSGAKTAGVTRSAYQYFEPADDPVVQANLLLQKIGTLEPGDLAPALDVEVTGSQSAAVIVSHIQTWITSIEKATGRVPFIYTSSGFWNASVASGIFSGVPLWVANWGVSCPNLPTAWTNWSFWQYTDAGSVPGIPNVVDLDEFNGSARELLTLAGLPTLRIASASSGAATVAWPAASTNFVLQQISGLGTTNWVSVTNSAVVVGNENQVRISPLPVLQFYRLKAR
jgi:GH25 family lysozyme M1 (1,4-beta-N-acetylmuramidase)